MTLVGEIVSRLEEMRKKFQGLTSRGVVNFILDELHMNPYYSEDPSLLRDLLREALRLLREDLEEILNLENYITSLIEDLERRSTENSKPNK